MELPNDFIISLNDYYGNEATAIINAILTSKTPTSIRYNTIKSKNGHQGDVVLWHPEGRYLDEKPVFTLDPHFHGGKYYVQEASSMFIREILCQLNVEKNARILDLCAAPGGKSTLLADFFKEGLLVSNEIIKNRAQILKENIIKWGSGNVVVTNNEPKDFFALDKYFDLILVDAPCSGEGMFRKDTDAIQEWSLRNVDICVSRQREIIKNIVKSLKPEGHIIYCTCTYNQNENIENVSQFCEEHNLKSIPLITKEEWNLEIIKKENRIGYQFLPHKVKGEGFFVSVMQKSSLQKHEKWTAKKSNLQKLTKAELDLILKFVKTEDLHFYKTGLGDVYAYNEIMHDDIHVLLANLKVIHSGIKCGNLNKNVFIPDHSLAMSMIVADDIPKLELDKKESLAYLNKTLLHVNSSYKGWCLVCFEGTALGWVKNLGNRINNYYPSEWRIRMDITNAINV